MGDTMLQNTIYLAYCWGTLVEAKKQLIQLTQKKLRKNRDDKVPPLVDVAYDESEGGGNPLLTASLEVWNNGGHQLDLLTRELRRHRIVETQTAITRDFDRIVETSKWKYNQSPLLFCRVESFLWCMKHWISEIDISMPLLKAISWADTYSNRRSL